MSELTTQLAALEDMTVSKLRERYREVFGEPTRSRNKDYLRKKIAWRIQELAEGGLSKSALRRIKELASYSGPGAWKPRSDRKRRWVPNPAAGPNAVERLRDPRLPPPGTVLRRTFRGVEHECTVLDDGFEYDGQTYRSLSKVAYVIARTRWNGYLFWGLSSREEAAEGDEGR